MIENNLILELLKIEIKKERLYPKDIFSIQFNDDKRILDKFSIGLTLDVSTFDNDLVEAQLIELFNYQRKHKIGNRIFLGGLIDRIEFNQSQGIVNFSMYKYYFEDLKRQCFL